MVFASNARGTLPLSVAAWSVAEQARDSTVCDICILSDGIPAAQQESLRALIRSAGERHRVFFIEIDRMLPERLKVVGERWPRVAWARVFLPDLLPRCTARFGGRWRCALPAHRPGFGSVAW